MEDIKNNLIELLKDISEEDICDVWNAYIYEREDYDNEIFTSDRFNEVCEGMDADTIACKVFFGDFNPTHNYFKFDGYANFKSSDWASDFVYYDDLADYILEHKEAFDNYDIQEFLDDLEDNKEEDNEED